MEITVSPDSLQKPDNTRKRKKIKAWLAWITVIIFVEFQFFIQLSSGVMFNDLMVSFSTTALGASLLVGSYYYIYVALQTPAGMLIDRFSTRYILSSGALLTGIGCLMFATTSNIIIAEFGRLLMGGGSAFAFIGAIHITRQLFPISYYAFMLGSIEALGMFTAIGSTIYLASLLGRFGWRIPMFICGALALVLALGCWLLIHDQSLKNKNATVNHGLFASRLRHVIRDPIAWLNGMYSGLLFSVVTVFASLWGIPFLLETGAITLTMATTVVAMIYLGIAIGSPLMCHISDRVNNRRIILAVGSLVSALLMSIILYANHLSHSMLFVLLFLLGFFCSSYMINYMIANEIAPQELKNTYIGFTNTLSVGTAPLLQPLVGAILHIVTDGQVVVDAEIYSLKDYRIALSLMPITMLLAAIIAFYLPKRTSR